MKRNYDFSKAKRGAVLATPPGKTRITIRIDDDTEKLCLRRNLETTPKSKDPLAEPQRAQRSEYFH